MAGTCGVLVTLALAGCGGGYGGDDDSGASRVSSISVTPVEATITADGTQQFDAAVTDGTGATVSGVRVNWRSSETGIATIDSEGLATAVAPGATVITASVNRTDLYGEGGIVTSNDATLTVTAESSVIGLATGAKPMANVLAVLRDRDGLSQVTLTDAAGRYEFSVAGLRPPFLLRIGGGGVEPLLSAAVQPGIANANPVTDLLLRAWFRTQGSDPAAAFTGRQSLGALSGASLESLSDAMEAAFRDSLAAAGAAGREFSFFTTPHGAGGAGLDRVLARLVPGADAYRWAIEDALSGASAQVVFVAPDRAVLRARSGSGRVSRVALPASGKGAHSRH